MKNFYKKVNWIVVMAVFPFFLNVSDLSAQNEYFDHIPVWKVSSLCSAPAPCIANEEYNFYINGDTVIGNVTYKLLFKKGSGFLSWMAPPPPAPGCSGTYSYTSQSPINYVRSSGKQIYIWNPNDTIDYLLYDFDLSIGDTIPLTYNNYEPGIIVTNIDSLFTPYGYRKIFELTGNTWANELLEGIGHTRGFLEPIHIPLECGFTLECFSLNDTSYYPSIGPTCELNVGVAELNNNNHKVNIFPNPFITFSTIESVIPFDNAELNIFNVYGQLVRKTTEVSGIQIQLERGKLTSGIYFIQIIQSGEVIYTSRLSIVD